MWLRAHIWCDIHSDGLWRVWTICFGALMLLWPLLLYAAGYNVWQHAWYWLTYFL